MEEQDDFQKVDFTTRFDPYKGILEMHLLEILQGLDDDTKKLLLSDGGYWSLLTHEFAKDLISQFSRDNYNYLITELRTMILNSDAMPKVIREWATTMIESREHAKESESYWDHAYWTLYHFIKELDVDWAYHKTPKLPDRVYGKKYSEELMKEVELKIQEWQKEFPEIQIDVTD